MEMKAMDVLLGQLRAASQQAAGGTETAGESAGADFSSMLKASLDQVNGTQQNADALAAQFEEGAAGVNLQDVMISLQKANISFQTMVQVRNRLVSAYHEIMNIQA